MPLTLTRRPGEQIKISDDIFVTLVSLKNGQAKIRIEAPESIKILRTELVTQPQGEGTLVDAGAA